MTSYRPYTCQLTLFAACLALCIQTVSADDCEKVLVISESFEDFKLGPLGPEDMKPGMWIHADEGSVSVVDNGAAKGKQCLYGSANRWSFGFNMLADDAIEEDTIYEVRLWTRSEDSEKAVVMWSTLFSPDSFGQGGGGAKTAEGERFAKNHSTEYAETVFTHKPAKGLPEHCVLQIEARQDGAGYLDRIELYKRKP